MSYRQCYETLRLQKRTGKIERLTIIERSFSQLHDEASRFLCGGTIQLDYVWVAEPGQLPDFPHECFVLCRRVDLLYRNIFTLPDSSVDNSKRSPADLLRFSPFRKNRSQPEKERNKPSTFLSNHTEKDKTSTFNCST